MSLTPSVSVTRITGIWPLGAHFNALATTSSNQADPSRACFFYWTFGDSGPSGAAFTNGWSTAQLMNVAFGPNVDHVFYAALGAGDQTYDVILHVADGVETNTYHIAITAYDPVGANGYQDIYAVAQDGVFTGCPSAALFPTSPCVFSTHTEGDFGTMLDNYPSATRTRGIYMKRGNTYTVSGDRHISIQGPWGFDAWGAGSDPLIQCGANGTRMIPNHSTSSFSGRVDIRFCNLRLDPNGHTSCLAIAVSGYSNPVDRMTFLNLTCVAEFDLGGWWPWIQAENFLVGCYLWAREFAILGQNDVGFTALQDGGAYNNYFRQDAMDFDAGGGNVRVGGVTRWCFNNNTIDGGSPDRQHIKFHAKTGTPSTYLFCFGNLIINGGGYVLPNPVGDHAEAWPVDIAPTDDTIDERTTNFWWEYNVHRMGPHNERGLMVHASIGVIRGNLFDYSAQATDKGARPIVITRFKGNPNVPAPDDIWVYYNTGYSSATNPNDFTMVDVDPDNAGATNLKVFNNFASAPNYTTRRMINDPNGRLAGPDSGNNTISSTPGFAGTDGAGATPYTLPQHFKLQAGSVARNAGTPKPGYADIFGTKRPQGAPTPDIGFAEFSLGELFDWEAAAGFALNESEWFTMESQTNPLTISSW